MSAIIYRDAGALISDCQKYRFRLWRDFSTLDVTPSTVCFVMLNPSTADGSEDDPTIRKCVGFARRWGFTGINVVNLFAYRATDPKELVRAHRDGTNIAGDRNADIVYGAAQRADRVVLAWGAAIPREFRDLAIIMAEALVADAQGRPLWCLGRTKDHQPRHPLMLGYDTQLERFDARSPA